MFCAVLFNVVVHAENTHEQFLQTAVRLFVFMHFLCLSSYLQLQFLALRLV